MYPIVEIFRIEDNHQFGVFGYLLINKELLCATLEPPDYQNMQNVSCIPSGQYLCSKTQSPTYGEVYEVRHVPNRTHIYFHAGNLVEHTEGCILIGQFHGKLKGNRAILNSGRTYRKFIESLNGEYTFHLTIKECY